MVRVRSGESGKAERSPGSEIVPGSIVTCGVRTRYPVAAYPVAYSLRPDLLTAGGATKPRLTPG